MALEKRAFRVGADHQGERLDQFLTQAAGGVSRRQIRRLIDSGAVYVDGKRIRVASRRLRPDARVELYLGPAPAEVGFGPVSVLYEDDTLIAVDKPSGLPAQATVSDAVHNLFAGLRRFLGERDGKPPYLALHHRLDQGTSGVMLFAKHRSANRGLAEAFSQRHARKVYQALSAITAEEPPGVWTVRNRLSRLRQGAGQRRRVVCLASGGRHAETEFRLLQSLPGAAWIEAVPATGRTHQIRVHLADSGLPVLGDTLYGDDAVERTPALRLMLHAASLSLEHPLTGEALCIEAPLPEDFREEVRRLSRLATVIPSADDET